jgi:hypothetical protein
MLGTQEKSPAAPGFGPTRGFLYVLYLSDTTDDREVAAPPFARCETRNYGNTHACPGPSAPPPSPDQPHRHPPGRRQGTAGTHSVARISAAGDDAGRPARLLNPRLARLDPAALSGKLHTKVPMVASGDPGLTSPAGSVVVVPRSPKFGAVVPSMRQLRPVCLYDQRWQSLTGSGGSDRNFGPQPRW